MNQIITSILSAILALLSEDKFKAVVDSLLDKVEDLVEKSDNKIDDAIVLPLCKKLRELLDVPDND